MENSFVSSLKFALLPIAKVLVMCGLGFLLATRRVNILSASGIKLLSKLVFALFLPCLIFTELGSAITFQKMLQWWFIPVNVVLAAVVGCTIGAIVVHIVRPPREFTKFTIVMIGIGNIGNIPLVLIAAVCQDENNPFGDSNSCSEQGVAYISFGQWVGAVLVYTFVFHMFSPFEDVDCNHADPDVERLGNDNEKSVPLLNGKDHVDDTASREVSPYCNVEFSTLVRALKARLKDIFQPAVIASILALIVGAIPFLKNLLLTDNAPLAFFTSTLSILANAMIPCIMLALGGNLVGGPGRSKLGLRTTIAITFTRLCLIPAAGTGIVLFADHLGLLPENDEMFRFVLLLQHTMPSSILAGAVAALRGVNEKEASAILFWEHIFSVFSIALWLILYLNVLF